MDDEYISVIGWEDSDNDEWMIEDMKMQEQMYTQKELSDECII